MTQIIVKNYLTGGKVLFINKYQRFNYAYNVGIELNKKMDIYNKKNIVLHYDNLVQQHKWSAPEMIYNHLSKLILKDSKLLDIGVGTGISSERFYYNQVELYGLDNSSDLIEICKSKNIFKEVLLFDISKDEFPFPNLTFDCIICSGVLHFFSSLKQIFDKVSNVLKTSGYFAFTIVENVLNDEPFSKNITNEVKVFHHNHNYIESLWKTFNFTCFTEQTFTTITDLKTKETLENKLIILKKI